MNKIPKEPKSKSKVRFNGLIEPEFIDQLKQMADDDSRHMSYMINKAIKEFCAANKPNKEK